VQPDSTATAAATQTHRTVRRAASCMVTTSLQGERRGARGRLWDGWAASV
jgi:hypothetical protein